ncbi:MAG: hypothetical protein ACXVBE_11225 [Bdellovibrionota bacterium]
MKAFTLMILAICLAQSSSSFAASTVKFYRWNQGYRVESLPAFETEFSEEGFSALLNEPTEELNKISSPLYSGCYAVEKTGERSLASVEEKPTYYRVCLR